MSANTFTAIDPEQSFNEPTDIYNRAANWALAQLEGKAARLSAADQRKILGFVVGKGRITVEERGGKWLAFNWVAAAFGTDSTYNGCFDLATGQRIA
jgi:hypothetical protein